MGNTAKRKLDLGKLLIAAGVVCLAAAGIWYGAQVYLEHKAGSQAEELMEAVLQVREQTQAQEQYDEVETVVVHTEPSEAEQLVTDVYATVEFPFLSLTLPVLDNWSMERLSIAPCRYGGTAEEGDLVLMGHNYEGHFGGLKDIPIGASVRLELMDGTLYEYEIKDAYVIDPDQAVLVEESGYPLTVFTCTPGGQARFVINCGLVNG